jgi:hypothetical protein
MLILVQLRGHQIACAKRNCSVDNKLFLFLFLIFGVFLRPAELQTTSRGRSRGSLRRPWQLCEAKRHFFFGASSATNVQVYLFYVFICLFVSYF